MSKIEPKFGRNERVEFVLRDNSSKSGYRHHVGYVKRSVIKKSLFRRGVVLYDLCEAAKEERLFWCGVPESDILGTIEYKKAKKDRPIEVKEHKMFNSLKQLCELNNL